MSEELVNFLAYRKNRIEDVGIEKFQNPKLSVNGGVKTIIEYADEKEAEEQKFKEELILDRKERLEEIIRVCFKAGDLESVASYSTDLEDCGEAGSALHDLTRSVKEYILGEYETALWFIESAVAEYPNSKECKLWQLNLYDKYSMWGTVKLDDAESAVECALKNFGKDVDVLEAITDLYIETFNDYEKAKEVVQIGTNVNLAKFAKYQDKLKSIRPNHLVLIKG